MILPDFILPSRVNQCWKYSGLDTYEYCQNKKHFKSYPYSVEYNYNHRGFRDQEWPDSVEELKNSIWCIGDSFTMGLGNPWEHTWPRLLQKQTGHRTINVSLDGASNNWIGRKAVDVLEKIKPCYVVLHWSFLPRRELDLHIAKNIQWNRFYQDIKDPSWPACATVSEFDQLPDHIKKEINTVHGGVPLITDEHLRCQFFTDTTDNDDLNNTIQCIDLVNSVAIDTRVLHSFVPEFSKYPEQIYKHLKNQQLDFIPEFPKLDLARDYFHYDIVTSQMFVNQITNWLGDAKCL